MELSFNAEDIRLAENYLVQNDYEHAVPLLEELRESMELYIDAECETTDKKQFFAFDSTFERLAYRRVENDPRELVQVPQPFGWVYYCLARGYVMEANDLERARDMLMQAVRWNPMNCSYRLQLAEVFRELGNTQEWAQLSHSVLERASDAESMAWAYANLGQFFLEDGDSVPAAVGCARLGLRLAPQNGNVQGLVERLHEEQSDACTDTDEHVLNVLAMEGVPTSPSAEIAVCLIMCASDAMGAGDRNEATRLTVRARDLVGQEACEALIKLVHESDAELAQEQSDGAAAQKPEA